MPTKSVKYDSILSNRQLLVVSFNPKKLPLFTNEILKRKECNIIFGQNLAILALVVKEENLGNFRVFCVVSIFARSRDLMWNKDNFVLEMLTCSIFLCVIKNQSWI